MEATTPITRCNDELGTFSERFPILFDPAGRLEKADKVIAVLKDFFGSTTPHLRVLDIGCSTGIMTRRFAEVFGAVYGLDNDAVGIMHGAHLAREAGLPEAKLSFCGGDACRIPLADESVDAVICNQVYEHVDDQHALVAEIHRVLRPGGACYFGAGTRHVLVEGHYKLPFLSWLPHWAADTYMRLAGKRGRYDVRLLSYRNLRRLVRQFGVIDYTLEIARRPQRFAEGRRGWVRSTVQRLPFGLLRILLPVIPIHVWVLVKPGPDVIPRAGEFMQRRLWRAAMPGDL